MSAFPGVRALPMWRALGVRDFRLLWVSEAVSVIGDQFHYVAMAWLVIDLTRSGLALGTVMIAVGVPRAIMLMPFGVLADRRPPRSLMLMAHVGRGVIVGAIAALVLTGSASLPVLALLGAAFGVLDALYLPAQQAFLPRTLEPGRLPSANALLQGTMQLASVGGPPLAGAAIAVMGTGAAFSVDAASFLVAAVVVMLISSRGAIMTPAAATAEASDAPAAMPGADASFAGALRDGIRHVLADPPLRTTLLISLVFNFALSGPATVGMPWLAEIRFGAGPAGMGMLAAAWAAGALVGTLVAGNRQLERQGRTVLGALAVSGGAMVAVGVAPSMALAWAALAAMGVCIGYVNVVAVSWVQARVPSDLVGRVMSLVMLMGFGIMPLSLGVAGALLDVEATALFLGSGAIVLLTAAAAAGTRYAAAFDRPVRPALVEPAVSEPAA